VTHDQKEALSVGDRIAVMEAGKVLQVGPARDVYRKPSSQTVADFIGETNLLTGKVTNAFHGKANVTTPVGAFFGTISTADWHPKAGDEVMVSIRPESWKLLADAIKINGVKGKIDESTYLGEMAQHEFATGDVKLKIYEMNPKHAKSDKELYAVVDPDDVVILPK
jgi:iron(III) transport system ATP-binding protein